MIWTLPSFWVLILVAFIFCTAISGIYPAFVLSNYKPSKVLKGNFNTSQSGTSVRRALVIVQFGLSVIMIMSIYVITQQLFFLQDKELGISVDQVLVIRTNDLDVTLNRGAAYDQFKAKIETLDHIVSSASCSNFPGAEISRGLAFQLESDAENKTQGFPTNQVSSNYFNTMGLTILHGRGFTAGPAADMDHVIINETASKELGFAMPETSIGHQLILPETGRKYKIIGVIKDFNVNLKSHVTAELFFRYYLNSWERDQAESPADFFLVKLSTADLRNTVASIEKEWKALFPQTPFDYFFLDTYFDTFYKEEKQFAGVFSFFAVIGVLVTCMGLFGLSLFDTNSRIKEIGIRKSLGASMSSIMWLFSKSYMKLVLIAGVIAMPVGIFLLHQWLGTYPQRISLAADAVLLPLALMCCIAIVTVGYHTYKTACLDPVKSLRAD
jgi:putative ABC transport system permease protein